MTRRRSLRALPATTAALALTACGLVADDPDASSAAADDHYPVTVKSCGHELEIPARPERAVLLKSAAVPYLTELDVLDSVVARGGAYPDEYYDAKTRAALADTELITDRMDPSGHLLISREAVVDREPDLVLGQVDNLDASSLSSVGIPLVEVSGLCPGGLDDPGFDDIGDQLRTFGTIYDREDAAAAAVTRLEERVQAVRDRVAQTRGERTAAVLYPTVGGGTLYAYGSRSMADPQLEAAGLDNVFGDVDKRVFELTTERLLEADPDVLVLLHSDGDPAQVEEALTALPGAGRLTAVAEDRVITQLFNFTEPPTPLAVDGLERITAALEEGS